MKIESGKLKSGLPVVVCPMTSLESVTVGFWVGVGGRYEERSQMGISHFIEHLLFKGTKKRNALQITEAIEGVGGYLNAFTSEENTCYYASATARHLDLILEVLSDMVLGSHFPADEVERERGVICEEIRMYEDQPSQVAQESLNEVTWGSHPLGYRLTGNEKTVLSMSRRDLMDYWKSNYHAGNLAVVIAGKTSLAEILPKLEKILRRVPSGKRTPFVRQKSVQKAPQFSWIKKPIEQTHLAFGFPSISRHDSRRFALKVMSTILGENMSSRLFQEIREKNGLAYSIHSQASYFDDAGLFLIQSGVDTSKSLKSLRLTLKAIDQMRVKAPSSKEVSRAKEYVMGQFLLGLESSSNQMIWAGESLIGFGSVKSPETVVREIEKVTATQVHQIAREILNRRRLNLVAVAPELAANEMRGLIQ
jgi:predicted Zn-dependent peptidase